MRKFPPEIRRFANQFIDMQNKRHRADYDPNETLFKSGVVLDIEASENAIRLEERQVGKIGGPLLSMWYLT